MATSKRERKIIALTTGLLIAAGAVTLNAHTVNHEESQTCGPTTQEASAEANRQFDFKLKEIIRKSDDDLIRICGELVGRPHTSARIDSITLKSGHGQVTANDIDGIDFERYFLWEDDGKIYIEIDFPGYKQANHAVSRRHARLIFHTAKGDLIHRLKPKSNFTCNADKNNKANKNQKKGQT